MAEEHDRVLLSGGSIKEVMRTGSSIPQLAKLGRNSSNMAQQLLHAPSAELEPLTTIGEVDFELADEVTHTDAHTAPWHVSKGQCIADAAVCWSQKMAWKSFR